MDSLIFTPFTLDAPPELLTACREAAMEKLQTLYPGKRLTVYGDLTLGIETDCLYCDTGIETYRLGLLDDELPALQCERTEEVLTFRL